MKKFFLVLLFLSQVFNALSQDGYKFRTLSPEGGFYFDGVKQIKQDTDGFIWILMDHDLYRFDGYQYKRYHTYFTNQEKSVEWVFKELTITSSGYFFVNTNNGLYSYDKASDTFGKVSDEVDLIRVDNRNNIWIRKNGKWSVLNENRSPFNINDSILITPLYDGKEVPFIGSVFCTNNDDLYTFSNYYRIYRYNYTKNEFFLCFNLPNKESRLIAAKAHKGKLWALTQKYGLYKIDLSTFAIDDHIGFSQEDGARALHIDKRGYIWIGTIKGLYVIDPDTRKSHHYVHSKSDPFSLPNNSVWTINEDNQRNIWIGTYSGAIAYVNLDEKKPFDTYMPHENKLSHTPVSAFAEDDTSLWIGTEGGGINRLNKKTGEFSYYTNDKSKNSPAFDNIKSIVVDKGRNLWIALFNGGLDYYNTKSGRFYNFKQTTGSNSLLYNSLRKIVLESDSGLWIAYQRKKVEISFYSFKTKQFYHHSPEGENTQYIFDMLRGRENQLWVLSNENLYLMDIKTNIIRKINRPDSVFLNFSTFCLDNSGNLWIGTIKNGLVKYDVNADKFILFDKILNYNVSSIYSINYDGEDNLWMGTDDGLFRYSISDNTFFEYDKGDGTQGRVYYPLASMKSMGGKLYFGGTIGFTVIDPKEVSLNMHKPEVIISDFYIDHQSSKLNFSSKDSIYEIVLNHNQANFGFKFSSDNFFLPEKNHFKYRLRGYDNRWIEVDA
ncbi:MAG: hybrid sensor histidine kinase/response regulator, partial [Prevotella sp.]|nr:hybrid sensor histidine kinase/response regulator [Prevotella sp.]